MYVHYVVIDIFLVLLIKHEFKKGFISYRQLFEQNE